MRASSVLRWRRSPIAAAIKIPMPWETLDRPVSRPVITRQRSWRGVMQVRHDAVQHTTKQMAADAVFFSPLKLVACAAVGVITAYLAAGHDVFMHELFGFESESMVEERIQGKRFPTGQKEVLDLKPWHMWRNFVTVENPNVPSFDDQVKK
jgi:hypothetical protein